MLENKMVAKTGVLYSQYIASWRKYGSTVYGLTFRDWLAFEGCTDREIEAIVDLATTGSNGLDISAKEFWVKRHLNPYK